MKKVLNILAMCVLIAAMSCSLGRKPADRVDLQQGKVEGNLAEFIEVASGPYTLEMPDTTAVIHVKVTVIGTRNASSMAQSEILLDSTYVEIVDSLGQALGSIKLQADSAQLRTLNSLLSTKGVVTELTFTSAQGITDDIKFAIEDNATSFVLHGLQGYNLDEAAITRLLNRLNSGIAEITRIAPDGCLFTYNRMAYTAANGNCRAIVSQLSAVESLMNPEQLSRFKNLRARYARVRNYS